MSAKVTTTELRKMQSADLLKEINGQQNVVVKLRLGVKLGKEKDSAKYIREKKQLARMRTIYSEMSPKKPTSPKIDSAASSESSELSASSKKKSLSSKKSSKKVS